MRTRIILSLFCALLAAGGCGKRVKVENFDKKLDARIQRDLKKRMELVQSNPVYLALVSDLQKGRSFLLQGDPKKAFGSFDKILQNPRYTNYPEYSYAKYYLAVSLHEMGVDYGALLYFVDIVQKEPLRAHTHESLRRAIAIAQKLKDDELILYLASTITADKIPRSLREEFRYFVAKDLYQKKQYDKAARLLKGIPHRNRLYLASRYLMGTMAILQSRYREGIRQYQAISNTRSPVVYYEAYRIKQLANLALGRIFYERKNFPLSIVYYKKVDRDGEFFASALYESSWALFKLHKFNESLSVLHSLNSPFFEQIFFLKSLLLKGAIFLDLCHYEDAVKTLSSLEKKFNVLQAQIDRFARQARNPKEYYPLLSSRTRTKKGKEHYTFEALFKLAAANRDFLGVHKYIERLGKERKTLAELKSARGDLLSKLIHQKSSELVIKASWLSGKKLLITRKLIRDYAALKDTIRLEIISAERKILQSRTRGIAPPVLTDADVIRPKFTESLKETLVWWDYNGEYWADEVGTYLYNLETRCRSTAEAGQ